MQKVVKLNKRHNLFKFGYTHALRFERRTPEASRILQMIRDRFGVDNQRWFAYRARKDRPLWIGFKDEKIISFILML